MPAAEGNDSRSIGFDDILVLDCGITRIISVVMVVLAHALDHY